MRSSNGNNYTAISFTPEEKGEFEAKMGSRRFKIKELSNGAVLIYADPSGNRMSEYNEGYSKSHPYKLQFSTWARDGSIFEDAWGTSDVLSHGYIDGNLRVVPNTSMPMRARKHPEPVKPKTKTGITVSPKITDFQGMVNAVELINQYATKNKMRLIIQNGKLAVVIGGN